MRSSRLLDTKSKSADEESADPGVSVGCSGIEGVFVSGISRSQLVALGSERLSLRALFRLPLEELRDCRAL